MTVKKIVKLVLWILLQIALLSLRGDVSYTTDEMNQQGRKCMTRDELEAAIPIRERPSAGGLHLMSYILDQDIPSPYREEFFEWMLYQTRPLGPSRETSAAYPDDWLRWLDIKFSNSHS